MEELRSEDIEELVQELEEESTAHERVEEGRVPVVDLEASQEEASVPPDLEVSLPSLDWKFWLDFVGAGLLGGLTVGALGGFAAGTALYTVQGGLVAGALGGAVGGLVGGLVQWLALRRYTAKAGIWVIVCCLVGVVTWAMATGWAEASGDTWDVIAQVGTWVIAGILAGAVGGAVSGFVQARLLRQRISRVANRWVLVNTVGWAAGGAVFLPAYWGWGIGLIGGGNPGAAAGEAIRSNDAICMPVCLTLFAVVPIWAVIQAIRQRPAAVAASREEMQPGQPQRIRRRSPLVWIVVGGGLLVLLCVSAFVAIVLSEVEPDVEVTEVRLTDGSAFVSAPAWSPDGSRIAFDSHRGDNSDIYVMNADGTNVVRLTDNPDYDGEPNWSPDGSRIAFVSGQDAYGIHVMDADGSNVVLLGHDGGDPAWSPDGSHLAFTSGRFGDRAIFVMDADGSNVVRLTENPATANNPAWSPDGSRIAFDGYVQDVGTHIYVMDADGSNLVQLTDSQGHPHDPAWSPDGSRIAFLKRSTFTDDHVYMMDADGANVVRLSGASYGDADPAWSPDGSRIAFHSNREGVSDIYVIEVDK